MHHDILHDVSLELQNVIVSNQRIQKTPKQIPHSSNSFSTVVVMDAICVHIVYYEPLPPHAETG